VDRITIKPYGKEKKVFKDDVIVKKKTLGGLLSNQCSTLAIGSSASRVLYNTHHKISTSTLSYDEKDVKIHQI